MYKYIIILFLVFIVSVGNGQTYNPSLHLTTNKSVGIAQSEPTDARTYYYDAVNFTYRPFQNTTEVLTYLNLAKYRTGQFDIIVNTGGVLSGGLITGGINRVYYFKNGTADSNLVLKFPVQTVNGQIGDVVVKNADSIRNRVVDTTVASGSKNNYLLTYDSTNNKWKLTAPASAYTPGTGIEITSNVIAAKNTDALWNANSLRGRSITTSSPSVGQTLSWNGVSWIYSSLNGLDTAYIANDSLFLVNTFDTIKVDLSVISTTASNGLTKDGQDIKLGGTLTENTNINAGDNNLFFEAANANVGITAGNGNSNITVTPATFEVMTGANTSVKRIRADESGNEGIVVSDGVDSIGFVGANLSSSKILANDTAYTRVREVKRLISDSSSAANNGLSKSGSNIVLGQDIGEVGDPAALTSPRIIPMTNSTPIILGDISGNSNSLLPNGISVVGDSANLLPARILMYNNGAVSGIDWSVYPTKSWMKFGASNITMDRDGSINIGDEASAAPSLYKVKISGDLDVRDSIRLGKVSTGLSTDSVLVKGTDGVVRKYGQNIIAFNHQVWIDSASGNDLTGQLGNPAKPFSTLNAALDALPSNGGVLNIGFGTYSRPDSSKFKDNLWFKGSKQPTANIIITTQNLSLSNTVVAPTKLIGGTIIQGGMRFKNKNNITISDLGVDIGSDYVSGGGSPNSDGLGFSTATSNSSTPPYNLTTNLNIYNVTVLLSSSGVLYHACVIEDAKSPNVNNLTTYYGFAGFVAKSDGGNFSNIHCNGHGIYGIILKTNQYSYSHDINLNNFEINSILSNDGKGLYINNQDDVNTPGGLRYLNINNGLIHNTQTGIVASDSPFPIGYVNINNCNIRNVSGIGIDVAGAASSMDISNCIIDSSGSDGIKVNNIPNIRVSNSTALHCTGDGFDLNASGGGVRMDISNCSSFSNGGYGFNAGAGGVYQSNLFASGNILGATTGNFVSNDISLSAVSDTTTYKPLGVDALGNRFKMIGWPKTFTLPSLTSGSVLFSNGTTIAQDNSNFFWDNTNKRLGIGTSAPFWDFSLLKTAAAGQVLSVVSNGSGSGFASSYVLVGSNSVGFNAYGTSYSSSGSSQAGTGKITSDGSLYFAAPDYKFYAGNVGINTGTSTPAATLEVNGNTKSNTVTINTTNPAGFGLNVNRSVAINKDSATIVGSITNQSVLIIDTITGQINRIVASNLAGTTIYNGDGTLSGNRTVTMSGNTLNFTGGNTGFGVTSPTGIIHLKAGTSSASTAPIKFTSGTLNTTAEVGTHEYNGSHYETKASGLRYATGGVVADFYTDVNNSGTSETDIYSYTTPASTLANDGEKLTFSYALNLNDITASSQLKVYFAGVAIANTGAITIGNTGVARITGWVIRTGSTTARASVTVATGVGSSTISTSENDLTSLTFTNTNILKVTAQAGGAGGGSNDITGKMGTVSWWGTANN